MNSNNASAQHRCHEVCPCHKQSPIGTSISDEEVYVNGDVSGCGDCQEDQDEDLWNKYNSWAYWRIGLLELEDVESASKVLSVGCVCVDLGFRELCTMGNLQGSEGGKRGIMKLKKSPRKGPSVGVTGAGGPPTPNRKGPGGSEGVGGDNGGPRGGNVDPRTGNASRSQEQSHLVVTTDSWRQVGKIQSGEVVRTPSKESSSGESVFTDPAAPCAAQDLQEEEDDLTLTMDGIHLEECATPSPPAETSQTTKEIPGTKFTIVRHRKAELAPSRISDQSLNDLLTGI